MMEERNHETTGQAMGASEPKAQHDAVAPEDPSLMGATGTAPRHPALLTAPPWAAGASGSIASACAIAVVGPGWCRGSG